MNNEYECKAWIDGKLTPVVVSYEIDDMHPLVYGIFSADMVDTDLTDKVSEPEFDRIYQEISADIVGTMIDAAEYLAER